MTFIRKVISMFNPASPYFGLPLSLIVLGTLLLLIPAHWAMALAGLVCVVFAIRLNRR